MGVVGEGIVGASADDDTAFLLFPYGFDGVELGQKNLVVNRQIDIGRTGVTHGVGTHGEGV